MLKFLNILLLVNAGTLSRERFFNWLAILILRYSVAILSIGEGIRLYGGLFHTTSITHSFNLFISIIGAVVLLLTAFSACMHSIYTASYIERYKNKLISKMGEQFTIIEYPLIIFFFHLIGVIIFLQLILFIFVGLQIDLSLSIDLDSSLLFTYMISLNATLEKQKE